MKAVLVANGPLTEAAAGRLVDDARTAGILIGIDGGARHLRALGLRPDYVTGDFDSLSERERTQLADQGVVLVPTPDQEYTDLDKALVYTIETLGASEIRIHAATGGRLDHLYSVLSALVKHGRRPDTYVRLIDDVGETWLAARPIETLAGADLPGRTLSLMALGPVGGITMKGVRWRLTDESLAPGVRDGTLNVVIAETVSLSHESGDLLVLLHHTAADNSHQTF